MLPPAAFNSAAADSTVPRLLTPTPAWGALEFPARTEILSWPDMRSWRADPAASPTVPLGALMEPEFATVLAMRKTSPPNARIEPWLLTPAVEPPEKFRVPPKRKLLSLTSRVEAVNPPVFTLPPGPTRIPLWFMR